MFQCLTRGVAQVSQLHEFSVYANVIQTPQLSYIWAILRWITVLTLLTSSCICTGVQVVWLVEHLLFCLAAHEGKPHSTHFSVPVCILWSMLFLLCRLESAITNACQFALFCYVRILSDLICPAITCVSLVQSEDVYTACKIAMAELIMTGCTTSSDHLYIYPNDVMVDDSIKAAR